ncbi:DUF6973 domain-containing protein [Sphingomonas sp.]|jgi:hypothetical protein|uniref:DUF6973 domain-containing protein n=1 Tax=Sphingomonas sp. TaxID=28214 RepID=UPI002D7F0EB8|nr:hypothetical protein [Sphingomonas sp.]HEU0043910.1 hypothetical protein [Sphingomonas sp.]
MPDGIVIKGLLTNLTPAEKVYLLLHPQHISIIRQAADKALAEAMRRFAGPGLHNGAGDAFRHCYWSALLARDIGPDNARSFTTAHEGYSDNPAGERAMDLHNNAQGIAIGSLHPTMTDEQLAETCAQRLAIGRLATSTPQSGRPYPR